VRELHEYLSDGDIGSDLDRLRQILRGHLERELPALKASWRYEPDGSASWWSSDRWRVADEDSIAMGVLLPNPVDELDCDPSVDLYVPPDWPSRDVFVERLRSLLPELQGFEHINENKGWIRDYPLARYVEYSNFIHPQNGFEFERFLTSITDAVGVLLNAQSRIDSLLAEVKAGERESQRKPRPR
jgi:hypothetical protein